MCLVKPFLRILWGVQDTRRIDAKTCQFRFNSQNYLHLHGDNLPITFAYKSACSMKTFLCLSSSFDGLYHIVDNCIVGHTHPVLPRQPYHGPVQSLYLGLLFCQDILQR